MCIVKFDNWYYTSTSTALPCNVAGYTGSINYTCTTGTLSVTGSCSCATGYSLVSGVCTPITCSITSVSKLNNKTGLAYASSATAIPNTPTSACATEYTGSATYTCTTIGAATIVSNSCCTSCVPGSQTFSFTGGSQSLLCLMVAVVLLLKLGELLVEEVFGVVQAPIAVEMTLM